MPWIPHIMVTDDDPRVLESLVPGFLSELAQSLSVSPEAGAALRRGDGGAGSPLSGLHVKLSAHGFTSERLNAYRHRSPHHVHVHLVRERGGRFDAARRLLNEQLFAVVVSDLRFSDDAGGQRAGQLFIDEVQRIHPHIQGILYSAYPRPDAFAPDRFVRKGDSTPGAPSLAAVVAKALERHLAVPAVAAFTRAIADQGIVYQSDAFGTTLAQLFDLARLLGAEPPAGKGLVGTRRPLPCLLLDGESGTGKRGLAALFHAATDRRKAPLVVASCNELTNETLLRSTLFGHKRGAFTDARDDRPGLVATAGRGVILLDDFHRLPTACTAILHSFLEDGEYSRLGEEEVRRHADSAAVLTVETGPWLERRRSGELPLAFLARVERLPLAIPPLRERPDDIEAQARWLVRVVSSEVGAEVDLTDDAVEGLCNQPFADSNSRELRNVIERAMIRHHRETDMLSWAHLKPYFGSNGGSPMLTIPAAAEPVPKAPSASLNDWQRRLRALAVKTLTRGTRLEPELAQAVMLELFDQTLPPLWPAAEAARATPRLENPIPWPVWEDLWRCFAVAWFGGPTPAERALGIPANTLRQWINDRESK
ncbi:MAG: sigma 54-interacting transcriptional regulator [Isosphaeraceae bacterium]|nr:sigma 54-interacting transcriptional regulator [Isosphaeraceae bacterium]